LFFDLDLSFSFCLLGEAGRETEPLGKLLKARDVFKKFLKLLGRLSGLAANLDLGEVGCRGDSGHNSINVSLIL
jgi:hypothetical protein